jgi:alpha-glucosidase
LPYFTAIDSVSPNASFVCVASHPMPSNKPITTACDACRRRKVKCDGQQPCGRCRDAEIPCRTTSVRRKKGRQGATATVLHELRKAPAPTAQVQSVPSPQPTVISDPFIRQPGLLHPSVVQSCAEYFFPRMLGTVPILLPTTFQDHIARIEDSLHSYCLVAAFCAFVFAQTGYVSWLNAGNHSASLGRLLLDEAMAARRHLDPFSASTRHGITIAFLLYGCQIGMGNQRQAYYFLREATTLYTAGMLDPADADGEDAGNLFWLLLISERYKSYVGTPFTASRLTDHMQSARHPKTSSDHATDHPRQSRPQ